MKRSLPVVIIGGGISGIVAANKIKEKGLSVIVIEKNQSLGGRMATSRIDMGLADFGAQFFTVRTPQFQSYVNSWEREGWIKPWFGEPYKRYRGVEGMSQLVKHLAEGLMVKLNTKVIGIRKEGRSYKIDTKGNEMIEAGAVIITAPVPQTLDIFKKSQFLITRSTENKLESVQFDPCIVAVLTLSGPSSIAAPGHLDQEMPEGLERIVDHEKKNLSPQTTVSIYADGGWSKQHWNMDEESVLEKLIQKASRWLKTSVIKTKQLKKWRYAQATSVIREPFLDMNLSVPLFIAGDVFLHENDTAGRTRIESAVLSGLSAGEAIVKRLKIKS